MKKIGVGIVTARAGSKGLTDKNVRMLNGKPLLHYAIVVGNKSEELSCVYISTDSKKYELLAIESGASSLGLRSSELSSDTAQSIDVIIDFIESYREKLDYIVLLQPTSPIRTEKQIDDCIRLHLDTGESVVSVAKLDEPHPYKLKRIDDSGHLIPLISGTNSELPRQSLDDVYQLTGAIYVASVDNIISQRSLFSKNTVPFIMNRFSNIDSKEDFDYLEYKVIKGIEVLPE